MIEAHHLSLDKAIIQPLDGTWVEVTNLCTGKGARIIEDMKRGTLKTIVASEGKFEMFKLNEGGTKPGPTSLSI